VLVGSGLTRQASLFVMKLDASALRYLSDDDFRVLTGVEMGMRNHDLVPVALISAISGLKHGGSIKSLKTAHKHKLVHKESKRYVGYRLTTLGYDYLALRALVKRGVVSSVGRQLGVGKEADVFLVTPSDDIFEECPEYAREVECWGEQPIAAMKLHRLGRTSFRAVKAKRDYLQHRKSASWIYFSRLAAIKEYAFMCALHERGFPVPRPLGHSRHVVVMQLVDGVPLNQVAELSDAPAVAAEVVAVIARLARHGLVHCDLNEFNVMIGDDERITVIDFPQMVSTRHPDAKDLYDRDMHGIVRFFGHRFGVPPSEIDTVPFEVVVEGALTGNDRVDVLLAASGFGTSRRVEELEGEGGHPCTARDIVDDHNDLNADLQGIDMTTLALPRLGDHEGEDTSSSEREFPRESTAESRDNEDVEKWLPANPGVGTGLGSEVVMNGSEKDLLEDDDVSAFSPELGATSSKLNRGKIADRVRRQRANKSTRKQLATRNLVKDSEKRKAKIETEGSSFWG
jgi:RIO-like serine/threonine protein kinase